MLPARSAPRPLPLQIAAKKVELANALVNAHLENFFDKQMTRPAVAKRFVIARHDERIDAGLCEPVVKRNRTLVKLQLEKRKRALLRCAAGQRAIESVDSRIEVRRLTSLPFPAALLDNETLFEARL